MNNLSLVKICKVKVPWAYKKNVILGSQIEIKQNNTQQ